ncbi:MAG: redoxin domain-containing protein [Bacteroidales bacterium]|nr:redoxin domain-containing protein [Bacteroidales bacterium]
MKNSSFQLKYLFLTVLLIGFGSRATAETTKLSGNAPSYAGEEIIFYSYSNMISFREIQLGTCIVNDSGLFECSIDLDETRLIFTNLGIYNCFLYAEPGYYYELKLPEKRKKTDAEAMNPYFENISIHLVVKIKGSGKNQELPDAGQELNFIIRTFNDSFYPYYYKYVINAIAYQPDRKEIDKVIAALNEPYSEYDQPYFKEYLDYRTGLLEHHAAQRGNREIIDDYFSGRPFLQYNPAFMELFNEIFTDYFELYIKENPESNLYFIVNRERSLDKLRDLIKKDKSLSDETMQELVIIKSLYDAFYDARFSKSSIIMLMDSINAETEIEFHQLILSDIKYEITKLAIGFEPPPFELYNHDSTLISLNDFQGEYVYLGFCNSFSYACIKEFELLKDMNSRYEQYLKIVTILIDDSFETMRNLVESNNYSWTFLHYSNNPEILDDYDIKGYPTYFLIDKDGKLMASPATSPAEGFERFMFSILRSRNEF